MTGRMTSNRVDRLFASIQFWISDVRYAAWKRWGDDAWPDDATRDRATIPAEHLCPWCNVRRKMSDSSATCGMLRCVLRMRRAEEQDRG